jgi:hypothetical protein
MATSANVHQNLASRDRKAKRLADKMFSGPGRREHLSFDEVENELETWKLRGYHGG